jgi:meso-butanediol dehydrogenase / (S,S)-butanediol dehydrogenase / diacetyl reductase
LGEYLVTEVIPHLSKGNPAGRLEGKVALITGAGSGQGRETALLFAAAGAAVFASDVNEQGVAETAAMGARAGFDIVATKADATSEKDVAVWVGRAVEEYGGVDILYNNGAGVHMAPFAELTLHQWRETLRLELDVVFVPTKAVWPLMIARGGGSIINIASTAGMRADEGVGIAAHAAGKGGVIAVTRQLSLEGAPHWIRVNSISPGPIMTPGSQQFYDNSARIRGLFDGWPSLGRPGRPIEVAYAGLFLASDESCFITGINLPVDGGATSKAGVPLRQTGLTAAV